MLSKFNTCIINFIVIVIILTGLINNVEAETPLVKVSKIVGGRSADIDAWPWMAGLIYKAFEASDGLFCGASLIARNWVLTAAHCVINENNSSFDVVINQPSLGNNSGERLSIKRIIIHPQFNNITFDNDLALIELQTSSQYLPVKILSPYTFQDEGGKNTLALGWGITSATDKKRAMDLHQVELTTVDNSVCSENVGSITENMLCAGDIPNNKDTCMGDSGGPLIVFDTESNSWRQAGITSWGIGCATGKTYGVYTRVKNYAPFISENICSAEEKPLPVLLNLSVEGKRVTATWEDSNIISGYRLNYAPYPHAMPIYSLELNQASQFSVNLDLGDAYYVAITSYIDNCLSNFSNIEYFIIQ